MTSLIAFFLLLIPGLVWQMWGQHTAESLPERLADALGISLALPPLVGLALSLLGWRVSALGVLSIYGSLGVLGMWALRRRRRQAAPNGGESMAGAILPQLAPLLAFALVLGWRFYQMRDLALPAWVDSLHHTLIVRLMLENGGIPTSFEPYMPVPFYYHFGFHLNTALFAFFARLPPVRAVMLFGQVINAAVALGVYRLAMALWKDWRRASVAMLLVGFVFQMPAYYLTWGRYTLLTGLVLLSLGMSSALDIAGRGATRERKARLALLTGGALLTHYFAALLLGLFIALLWIERTLFKEVHTPSGSASRWGLLESGFLGGVLASPWLGQVWEHARAYVRVTTVLPGQTERLPADPSYLWYLLGPQRSHLLLFVALISLGLIGWRARTRPLALWALALGVISLPWGIQLAPFRPDHGAIVTFLPASLLVADALLTPMEIPWRGWLRALARGLSVLALLALLGWGIRETRDILNPVTILATEADVQALQWIESHIPQEARFLINVTPWQWRAYRGVDGGWWILPLTGRETVLPPVMYTLGEADYVRTIHHLAERTSQLQGCTPEFWELITEAKITHIYLGPTTGSLTPESLHDCPNLKLLYSQDEVTIYQVDDQ